MMKGHAKNIYNWVYMLVFSLSQNQTTNAFFMFIIILFFTSNLYIMCVFRDDNGKPFVLPSVRAADKIIMERSMNKEYAAIGGEAEFGKLSANLAFGEGNKRIVV